MLYEAKITSKGQITLPVDLREQFGLKEGDLMEFYVDAAGRIVMRPRNLPASAVYEQFGGEVMTAVYDSDDDAIAAAILDKDERSKSKPRSRKRAA